MTKYSGSPSKMNVAKADEERRKRRAEAKATSNARGLETRSSKRFPRYTWASANHGGIVLLGAYVAAPLG